MATRTSATEAGTIPASVDGPDVGRREDPRSARAAAIVFAAYAIGAGIWLFATFGDRYWFKGDEWGFLVGRSLADPGGWFVPQNTHWSTVPIVVYQALFKVFGLGSYRPYLATVLVLHLVLAALLRTVMRRAGVGPWIATVVAGAFVLYGTGYWNILFAVQISMVASMLGGIGHLVLADHDGPFDRRDALGLALGAVALMASGVGTPLLVTVGIGVLLRRGWRLALVHTVPLVALYGLWTLWQHPFDQGSTQPLAHLVDIARFVGNGLVGVPVGLGQWSVVAAALALVLVGGLALAWAPLSWSAFRHTASIPLALGIGAALVLAAAGSQRYVFGPETARASHYQSMAAALLLPALAVAIAAFGRRWRWSAPALLVLLVIGVPGNISAFTLDPDAPVWADYEGQRAAILGAAASPLLAEVDRGVRPLPGLLRAEEVTAGYLIDAKATGKVPEPPPLSPKTQDQIDTRLVVAQSALEDDLPGAVCTAQTAPIEVHPEAGERFAIRGDVVITRADGPDAPFGAATTYGVGTAGPVLTVQLPDQILRVAAKPPGTTFIWCTAP